MRARIAFLFFLKCLVLIIANEPANQRASEAEILVILSGTAEFTRFLTRI